MDFNMGNHNKQKANKKSSRSYWAKKAANPKSKGFLQCIMDMMLSCGSSLCPVWWRSDCLEVCQSPWQFGILEFQNQNQKLFRLRHCSLGVFTDYCFRSLPSPTNQNWFMYILCTWLCLLCIYMQRCGARPVVCTVCVYMMTSNLIKCCLTYN